MPQTNPSTTKAPPEDLLWVDVARVIAMWSVVVIHVAADVITEWGTLPNSWWGAANFYDSLARGPVAIFIMLSGALLLPQAESYRAFFRKRFGRVLIPFLAWSLFYLLWRRHFYEPTLGPAEMLRRFATDRVYFHLWFMYVLIGLYLITPWLRVLVANASKKDLGYFLGLCFLVSFLLPFVESLAGLVGHPFHIKLVIEPVQGFVGYFVLGYFLRKYASEKTVPTAWLVWGLSLLVCFFGTAWACARIHSFSTIFYDNMAPNHLFFAAAFFILLKQASPMMGKKVTGRWRRMTGLVAGASFGIYLIHPTFIDVLNHGRWGFTLRSNIWHPAFIIPFVASTVYFLSLLAVLLIQRIPILRRTV